MGVGQGMAAVSLRGRSGTESLDLERMVSFRCPENVREYIKEESHRSMRKEARVIVQALELDRDLGKLLVPEVERLEAFAASQSLTLDRNLAAVLAALVTAGLNASEAKKPHKK
jgi:hypothetical protein